MPSVVKKMAVNHITAELKDVEGLVLVGLDGLDMVENEDFRNQMAEHGVRLRVVPNKLAHRALTDVGFEFSKDIFKGTVAVAAGDAESAINAAKVVTKSPLKKEGKVKLVGGALEGNVLGAADAAALADVPDRATLQAKLLGALAGPAQQLVGLLAAPGGSLARVIQAHADSEGEND
ncbi:MAG: 50S ribosomal protein L10 [Planctomycetota bacterium]|jgi:large subunit ribosomal protein L10